MAHASVKDRLAALVAAQSDNLAENSNNVDCMSNSANSADPMDAFFTAVQSIRDMTDKIRANIEQIKKTHGIILTTPKNDERTKQRLESLMDDTDRTVNLVREELKKLKILEEENSDKTSPANSRIHSTQLSSLSTTFVKLMTECNRIKLDYRERCKARLQRQVKITGTQITDEQLDEMLEQGSVAVFTQNILTETLDTKQILADMEARHDDIIKLGKSIKELHDMFVHMAVLVESQGERVDEIAYHVGLAKEWVEKADNDLRDAETDKGRVRKKKIAIAICFLITAVILIAVLVPIKL